MDKSAGRIGGLVAALVVLACAGVARAEEDGIEVLFSSANAKGESRIADRLIELIRGAKGSIDIAVAHLNFARVADAIVERRNQGKIAIRVLLDFSEYSASRSECRKLEEAKIDVRYKLYSLGYYHLKATLMHHKFMIVDDETVAAGSYNWSETAEWQNDENLLVFRSDRHAEVLAGFRGEFTDIWDAGRKTYPAFRRAVRANPRYLPVHFNTSYFSTPMALDRNEIEPILSAARKAGLYEDEKSLECNYFDTKTKEATNELPQGGSFLGNPSKGEDDPGGSGK